MNTARIVEIIIGKRMRKELGDIGQLAGSIEAVGLIQPVVLDQANKLIAGQRRVEAFKHLGRDSIPVIKIDIERIILGEYHENAFRKSLTPTEMVAAADAIRPRVAKQAAAREKAGKSADGQAGGRGRKKPSGKFPQGLRAPQTNDVVAKSLGVDRKTYEKAAAVVSAAEKNPKDYGDLPAMMDNKSVNSAFKELRQRSANGTPRSPEVQRIVDHPTLKAVKFISELRKFVIEAQDRFEEIELSTYGDGPFLDDTLKLLETDAPKVIALLSRKLKDAQEATKTGN